MSNSLPRKVSIDQSVKVFVDGLEERRFDLSVDCIKFFFGDLWSKETFFALFHEMSDRQMIDTRKFNDLLFMQAIIRKKPPAISFEEIFKNLPVTVKGK